MRSEFDNKMSMNDNTNGLTEHPDGCATLSAARLKLCLESAWELESIAELLPDAVENAIGNHRAVRGLADRIKRLAYVLTAGLSDDQTPTASLDRVVFVSASASQPRP